MFEKRLKIFITIFAIALTICILRLLSLQIFQCQEAREDIASWQIAPPKTLQTIRGKIKDRHGRIIATDKPIFHLNIQYKLARLKDDRFWYANELFLAKEEGISPEKAREKLNADFAKDMTNLQKILDKAVTYPGVTFEDILENINDINNYFWRQRRFIAWKRNCLNSRSFSEYEEIFPDEKQRLILEAEVNDLAEMHNEWYSIAKLLSEAEMVNAQLDFQHNDNVRIIPESTRYYPYSEVASHIIGWVSRNKRDEKLFEDDKFLKYTQDEFAGFDGVEYLYEPILRGKRGQKIYTRDGELLEEKPREFGKDVEITIDIELQQEAEKILLDPSLNNYSENGVGAVIQDVATGDIIAMVSLPDYDLNSAKAEYKRLEADPKKPLLNRSLYTIYPPGSSIKPIIYLIGLTMGEIGINDPISCSSELPPKGWPRCWIQRQWGNHDGQWAEEGQVNNGINALRGSCNIYFSRLANRLDPRKLQEWLFNMGLGRPILPAPNIQEVVEHSIDITGIGTRNLRQSGGIIDSKFSRPTANTFQDVPPLSKNELRWVGMGQGNTRVTVLQISNVMCMLARDGIYKNPRLFYNLSDPENYIGAKDMGFKDSHIKAVKDGMWAVVHKSHGTAVNYFKEKDCDFTKDGIEVYGKTGSTEGVVLAWFCGWAQDLAGRAVSIAVVVEGGQHGSSDAAPLARELLKLAQKKGYIGTIMPENTADQNE